jgi:hypothetical protein
MTALDEGLLPYHSPARRPGQHTAAWVALILWAGMAVAMPLATAQHLRPTLSRGPGLLALVFTAYSAARFCHLVLVGARRYMSLSFWLFVYIWFGLVAFIQIDAGKFDRRLTYIGYGYSDRLFMHTLVVVIVGCFAYDLGEWLRTHRLNGALRTRFGPHSRSPVVISLTRLRLLAVVTILLAIMFIVRSRFHIFATREDLARLPLAVSQASRMTMFAGAFLTVYSFRAGRLFSWRRMTLATKTLFVAAVGLGLLVNNPTVVQRALAVTVLGGVALAAIPSRSRWNVRLVFVGILFGSILLYPALTVFRSSPRAAEAYAANTQEGVFAPMRSASGDFAMFTQVADGIDYVNAFGETHGKHLMTTALFFVPRAVWHTKLDDVGDSVHDALGYDPRFNEASPLWMELYVDGGVALVIAGFVAFGLLSRHLELALVHRPRGRPAYVMPALACYQFYVLRGSTLAAAPALAAMLVAMFFVGGRMRSRRGTSVVASPLVVRPPKSSGLAAGPTW